ncbi:MAG: CDP-diacylglycerol--glycerol-3-phosphate 3-phosphatidyltransferase [Ruminococcaceae bacterium]|nr:CDP-diacylglycerol--glycerol-3-phosphate 3-phosphatidyltransferase [Oscillospiraceae bacterium]
MNLPNRLTMARIVMVPLFMLLFLLDFPFHYLLSGLVFGAAALTDLFDGKIARSRGLITNFGKFVDPIADKMLTTAAFIGLCAIGKMSPWALLIIMTREFAVTSVRLLAATDGNVIAANFWGKLKTVMQFVAILFSIAALEFSTWQAGLLSGVSLPDAVFSVPLILGEVLVWVSAVLTLLSGAEYVWANRRYFAGEK